MGGGSYLNGTDQTYIRTPEAHLSSDSPSEEMGTDLTTKTPLPAKKMGFSLRSMSSLFSGQLSSCSSV